MSFSFLFSDTKVFFSPLCLQWAVTTNKDRWNLPSGKREKEVPVASAHDRAILSTRHHHGITALTLDEMSKLKDPKKETFYPVKVKDLVKPKKEVKSKKTEGRKSVPEKNLVTSKKRRGVTLLKSCGGANTRREKEREKEGAKKKPLMNISCATCCC